MYQIDAEFTKLKDDETCALLKPWNQSQPPATHITNEILKVIDQFPEVRKRVIARIGLTGYTITE